MILATGVRHPVTVLKCKGIDASKQRTDEEPKQLLDQIACVLRRRSRCVIRVVRTKTSEILSAHQAWIGGAQSEAGSEENIPATRNSIARVALFNQDGLVGSRPLSEVEIIGFEERVNHQLRVPSHVSLISDRLMPSWISMAISFSRSVVSTWNCIRRQSMMDNQAVVPPGLKRGWYTESLENSTYHSKGTVGDSYSTKTALSAGPSIRK